MSASGPRSRTAIGRQQKQEDRREQGEVEEEKEEEEAEEKENDEQEEEEIEGEGEKQQIYQKWPAEDAHSEGFTVNQKLNAGALKRQSIYNP